MQSKASNQRVKASNQRVKASNQRIVLFQTINRVLLVERSCWFMILVGLKVLLVYRCCWFKDVVGLNDQVAGARAEHEMGSLVLLDSMHRVW